MGLFRKLANVVYPPKCIFCRRLLDHDVALNICNSCYVKLPFAEETLLTTSFKGDENYCDGAISVFQYTGVVKESLIRFKFYNMPSYFRTYARLIAHRLAKITDIKQYDMVMSVPLHKQKEFSRGYNQAYLISRVLSSELKLPECSRLLKRSRQTDSQSLLDKHKRHKNVQGAFVTTPTDKLKGKSILLVDDILTTGSTIEECCRILKQAGALKATAVVVASGRKY